MKNKDSIQIGALTGFLLPLIALFGFTLAVVHQFENLEQCIKHFQLYNLWYKILSLSLMPGAGLFFYWSTIGKINQARGVLLMTLFYGVFVILLYMW